MSAWRLGLRPDRTIYDLARSAGSIDAEKLDAYLATHDSGARVLLAPTRPDQAGVVTPELLATVYPVLRSMSDYVIVDTPPGFTPEVITSIDSSSDICLVGMLDSLSLKNTKLGLETLELMGYAEERTRLVLNRADSRVGITPADVHGDRGPQPGRPRAECPRRDALGQRGDSDRAGTAPLRGGARLSARSRRSTGAPSENGKVVLERPPLERSPPSHRDRAEVARLGPSAETRRGPLGAGSGRRRLRRGQEPHPPRRHRRAGSAAVRRRRRSGGGARPRRQRHPGPPPAGDRHRAGGPRAARRGDR